MLVHRRILDELLSSHGISLSDKYAAEFLSQRIELFLTGLVSLGLSDSKTNSNSFEEDISEEMLMRDLENVGDSRDIRMLDLDRIRSVIHSIQ